MVNANLALVVPLLLSMACYAKAAASPAIPAEASVAGTGGQSRVVIRTGALELRSKELEAAKTSIERIVRDVQGFVEDWSLADDRWLSMTVRVPEPALDRAMEEIATLGKVVRRSLSSHDVTDQMIDLEARLSNLRALRGRLRAYLEKASDLTEIIAVEKELARVQTEIEQIEGRLKVLRDQVAMSELTVMVRRKSFL